MFTFLLGHLHQPRRAQPVAMSQDPWGNGERNDSDKNKNSPKGNNGGNNDAPPDLEELIGNLFKKMSGGGGNSDPSSQTPNPDHQGMSKKWIVFLVLVGVGIWMATGFYTVRERENGVETFLGRYTKTTRAGLNWNYPAPLGHVEKVDVTSIFTMNVGELKTQSGRVSTSSQRNGQMLTSDENIVEIGATVKYRIANAKDYLYQANKPESVLRDIVVSAIREVVGANAVDDILINKRGEWPLQVKEIITQTLGKYNLGFEIIAFELQDARPPAEVQDAFEDAVRAREDEERLRLEAEAYARERLPKARGESERLLQSAQAYRAEVLAQATAETSRFNNLLAAYRENPVVMRERLYLDTMATVYAESKKVLIDAEGSRPIVNLGNTADNLPEIIALPASTHPPVPQNNNVSGNAGKPAAEHYHYQQPLPTEGSSRSRSRER